MATTDTHNRIRQLESLTRPRGNGDIDRDALERGRERLESVLGH